MKKYVISPGIFLLLISVPVIDSSHTGRVPKESDCFAPHLNATALYNFTVHTGSQQALSDDIIAGVQVFVSTQPLGSPAAKGERAWQHNIEVRAPVVKGFKLLSQDVNVSLIQRTCSHFAALPIENQSLSRRSLSFLRSILAMIPLSLQTGVEDAAGQRLDSELTMCMHWDRSTVPHSVTTHISEIQVQLQNNEVRRTTKIWVEEDECGDMIQHSVYTEMTGATMSVATTGLKRLLIPTACSATHCYKDELRGDDVGLQTANVLANLSYHQQGVPVVFESRVGHGGNVLLEDIPICDESVGKKIISKGSPDDTDFKFLGTGLLDDLLGEGSSRAFLHQRFQHSPFFVQGLGRKLVEGFTMDKMLDDYRQQDRMHLVDVKKCNVSQVPPLDNGTVALGLVSNFNCTIKLSFEQLPGAHLLTDIQSKLESEILCPVTSHVYVSSRNIKALDIHTDPYDVFVLQLHGSKRWKICLPRAKISEDDHEQQCISPADRALRREMQSWYGLGGTNYKEFELNSMDCEDIETRAGDLLYIPRSFVHVAEASSSEPSTHITFGLQEEGRRWRDVVKLAVQSVVCFARCDETVVGVIIDTVNKISRQKRGKHLDANRYRWYQAFPLWKCLGLSVNTRDKIQWETETEIHDDCMQHFDEFEQLILELGEYTLGKLKGHVFHAARHHLRQTRSVGIYVRVIRHLLDTVARDIAHNAGQGSKVSPPQDAWMQRTLVAEMQSMRGQVNAVSEKQDPTEMKQLVAPVQPRMSAAIHARFPYLFQDVQGPQEQVGGQFFAAGDPASSGRNSPKIASRSLLAVDEGDTWAINIRGCTWSCDQEWYSCGYDGGCDGSGGGCDGGGWERGCDNDWDCTGKPEWGPVPLDSDHGPQCTSCSTGRGRQCTGPGSGSGILYYTSCDHTCSQFDCRAGSYKAAGGCHPCSAGKYKDGTDGACSNCPSGKYSTLGSSTCTDCDASACPAGSYRETCLETSGCVACDAGKYSDYKSSEATLMPVLDGFMRRLSEEWISSWGELKMYPGSRRTFMVFQLDAVKASSGVTSASLRLYKRWDGSAHGHSCSSHTYQMRMVPSSNLLSPDVFSYLKTNFPWGSNAGDYVMHRGSFVEQSIVLGTALQHYTLDVTTFINAALSTGTLSDGTVGFELRSTLDGCFTSVASVEDATVDRQPTLHIEYFRSTTRCNSCPAGKYSWANASSCQNCPDNSFSTASNITLDFGSAYPSTCACNVGYFALDSSAISQTGFLGQWYEYGTEMSNRDYVGFGQRTPLLTTTDPHINFGSTSAFPWEEHQLLYDGRTGTPFAVRWTGHVLITSPGDYTFETDSDDGSWIWINEVLTVDNGGSHGMQKRSGTAVLVEGYHNFRLHYYQGGGGAGLIVRYKGPDTSGEWALLKGYSALVMECGICPVGTYNYIASARRCTPCETGKYSSTRGASSCTRCATGSVAPSEGASACTECIAGTYSDITNERMLNPPETARTYSSVYSTGHAQSMLDSERSWSARTNTAGEWMLMDLGDVTPVLGIVIQARKDYDQYVTEVEVQYSLDSDTGFSSPLQSRISDDTRFYPTATYSNKETSEMKFKEPIVARYLKIVVYRWHGHISMRAGVLSSSDVCVPCPAGKWSDGGSTHCTFCAPGSVTASMGAATCTTCPVGTYVESSGATTCIPCPANTTTQSTGVTIVTDCKCRAGYEGPPAGPCTPCEAGKFSAGLGNCIPCGLGNYSFAGSAACFSLEIAVAGEWLYLASSAGSGASQTFSITKGITRTSGIEQTEQWARSVEHSAATTFGHMYTRETSTEDTETSGGSAGFSFFGISFGGSIEHKKYYRDTNSRSTMQTASSSTAHEISAENAQTIKQSIEENTQETITHGFGNAAASGAGVMWQFKYKILHLWGDNTIGTWNTVLTNNRAERPCCLPTTFRDNTKPHGPCLADHPCICRPWVCTVCPAGKYKVEIDGAVSCAECEAGTYLTTEGSEHASDCVYCAAGKFSTVAGATAIDTCEDCGAGKYKALAGANAACDECEAGKYKADAGVNTACDECEAGKHKSTSGVNIACDDCEAGKYKADAGVNTACDNCLAGKYKAGAGVNTACDDCEAGKYSEADRATSQSDCLACEAGKTSAAGSDGASDCSFECAAGWTGAPGSCTRCPPGTFKAEPGDGPCLTCPAYSHSSRAGESSCQCNAGFTGPVIYCSFCAKGKFKTTSGSAACDNCIAGKYSQAVGADTNVCQECEAGKHQASEAATACDNCEAGKYKDTSGVNTACDDCEAGKFKANAGVNLACASCEAGKYKDTSGVNIACDDCDAGKFQASVGARECTSCPPNTWSAAVGASSDASCTPCPGDKVSGLGSDEATDCLCPAGKFLQTVGADTTVCQECEAGKFKALAGVNTECDDCGAGKYKSTSGVNTACDDCEAGKYKAQPGVNTACDNCEAGKYKAGVGVNTACDNCEAGKYKSTPGINTACDDCEAGKHKAVAGANTACDNCEAGKYKAGAGVNTACDNCEAGKYKAVAGVNTACDDCEAGKYKTQPGVNTVCDNCEAGKYKAVAGVNTACDNCEAGKYKAVAGVNRACDNCEAGKYMAVAGVNRACDNCEAGKYKAGAGVNTACDNCEAGKYKAVAGVNTACDNCEAGKYNAQPGVNTACNNCEAGKYKAGAGVNTACDNCEAGKYKAMAGVNTACDDCEAGKHKAASGVNTACDNCEAGKYKAVAGINAACDNCEAGKYKATAGTGECTNCPMNTWSAAVGAMAYSCIRCPGGTMSGVGSDNESDCKYICPAGTTGEPGSCSSCPSNTFKDSEGNIACTPCPGNSQSQEGSTECVCDAGYSSDSDSCRACEQGKYKTDPGNTRCTACPDNSQTAAGSVSSTRQACVCNIGFTGPNGGPCEPSSAPASSPPSSPGQGETNTDTIALTEEAPSSPPTTSVSTHVVQLSLSLPLSNADFDDAKQAKFKESIARAAGVSPADVTIDNVETLSAARRRLLVSSIRIDVSVKAKDKAAADAMGAELTAGNINVELSKAGLPEAQVLIKPSTTTVSADSVVTVSDGSSRDQGGGVSALPIISGAVGGVSLIGIAVASWWCWRQKNRPKATDNAHQSDVGTAEENESSTSQQQSEVTKNDGEDGEHQTKTGFPPAMSGALEALFEKHGLGNLFHKIREELALEDMSDLQFIRREDLEALSWLKPIPKNKLLALVSEAQQPAADAGPMPETVEQEEARRYVDSAVEPDTGKGPSSSHTDLITDVSTMHSFKGEDSFNITQKVVEPIAAGVGAMFTQNVVEPITAGVGVMLGDVIMPDLRDSNPTEEHKNASFAAHPLTRNQTPAAAAEAAQLSNASASSPSSAGGPGRGASEIRRMLAQQNEHAAEIRAKLAQQKRPASEISSTTTMPTALSAKEKEGAGRIQVQSHIRRLEDEVARLEREIEEDKKSVRRPGSR